MDIERTILETVTIKMILKNLDRAIEALDVLESEENLAHYNDILNLLLNYMEQTNHPNRVDCVRVLEIMGAENVQQTTLDWAIHWLYIARVLWRENPDARMLPFRLEDFNREDCQQ